ncbi:MAG: helix-turn-helix domain-containing protein [Oscillospiraceae bacterium]|nr:helix-turn-helix domain-containing protein [Oscillospiraceae bacterium]
MRDMKYRGKKNLISMQLHLMRVRRNVTQQELAARMQVLGVSIDQQSISLIERNKRIVTDYELACFCKALKCSEQELLQDFYEKYRKEEEK